MPVPSSREIQKFSIQKNVREGSILGPLDYKQNGSWILFLPGFYHSDIDCFDKYLEIPRYTQTNNEIRISTQAGEIRVDKEVANFILRNL